MSRHIETISTEEAPAAVGNYSQAKRGRGWLLTIAGQVALVPGPEGQSSKELLTGDNAGVQTAQALKNVNAILHAAGGTFSDVMKLMVFIADDELFGEVDEACGRFFRQEMEGVDPPARTCAVGRAPLPGALVEIDALAMLPAESDHQPQYRFGQPMLNPSC